jgi:hypothetical protein
MENEKKNKSWGGPWPCSAHKGLRPWTHVEDILRFLIKFNNMDLEVGVPPILV